MATFWKKKYSIYGNLQILVGCGNLVKSYWIQYAKPKPHLGFLEKLRCIYIYQILHLILNHYRMLTQLKIIFFEIRHFWRAFTSLFWIVRSLDLNYTIVESLNSTRSQRLPVICWFLNVNFFWFFCQWHSQSCQFPWKN